MPDLSLFVPTALIPTGASTFSVGLVNGSTAEPISSIWFSFPPELGAVALESVAAPGIPYDWTPTAPQQTNGGCSVEILVTYQGSSDDTVLPPGSLTTFDFSVTATASPTGGLPLAISAGLERDEGSLDLPSVNVAVADLESLELSLTANPLVAAPGTPITVTASFADVHDVSLSWSLIDRVAWDDDGNPLVAVGSVVVSTSSNAVDGISSGSPVVEPTTFHVLWPNPRSTVVSGVLVLTLSGTVSFGVLQNKTISASTAIAVPRNDVIVAIAADYQFDPAPTAPRTAVDKLTGTVDDVAARLHDSGIQVVRVASVPPDPATPDGTVIDVLPNVTSQPPPPSVVVLYAAAAPNAVGSNVLAYAIGSPNNLPGSSADTSTLELAVAGDAVLTPQYGSQQADNGDVTVTTTGPAAAAPVLGLALLSAANSASVHATFTTSGQRAQPGPGVARAQWIPPGGTSITDVTLRPCDDQGRVHTNEPLTLSWAATHVIQAGLVGISEAQTVTTPHPGRYEATFVLDPTLPDPKAVIQMTSEISRAIVSRDVPITTVPFQVNTLSVANASGAAQVGGSLPAQMGQQVTVTVDVQQATTATLIIAGLCSQDWSTPALVHQEFPQRWDVPTDYRDTPTFRVWSDLVIGLVAQGARGTTDWKLVYVTCGPVPGLIVTPLDGRMVDPTNGAWFEARVDARNVVPAGVSASDFVLTVGASRINLPGPTQRTMLLSGPECTNLVVEYTAGGSPFHIPATT